MKRIFTFFLAALVTVSALAQTNHPPIYSSANGTLTFNLLSYMGYGYHFVQTDEFTPAASGEVFLNVLQLGVFPTEHLGIELGADLAYNYFRSKKNMFFLDDKRKVRVTSLPAFEGGVENFRSNIDCGSVNFPLLVKGIFGKFQLGAGAEGRLNFAGSTTYWYNSDNRYYTVEDTKAQLNRFNYDILATVSYDDIGLYFKYYPKGSRLLPDGSVNFSWMTLGFVLKM